MYNKEHIVLELQQVRDNINDVISDINMNTIDRILDCWRCDEQKLFLYKVEDVLNDLKVVLVRIDELDEFVRSNINIKN